MARGSPAGPAQGLIPADAVLLDSTITSLYFKERDTRRAQYLPHLEGKPRAIAFVTVAEMYRWAFLRNWGQARFAELQRLLGSFYLLPYSDAAAVQWAILQAEGQRLSDHDAWIAALALVHDLTIVTDDQAFKRVPGLRVLEILG